MHGNIVHHQQRTSVVITALQNSLKNMHEVTEQAIIKHEDEYTKLIPFALPLALNPICVDRCLSP